MTEDKQKNQNQAEEQDNSQQPSGSLGGQAEEQESPSDFANEGETTGNSQNSGSSI